MATELDTITEVVECGQGLANYYLQQGYTLLYVDTVVRPAILPTHDNKPGFPYARRGPIYVLGRPPAVAHADRPQREAPTTAAAPAV